MTPKEIKKKQQEMRFSVSQMAREIGVARGTYDKWQRGEQKISSSGIFSIKALKFIIDRGLLDEFHDLP